MCSEHLKLLAPQNLACTATISARPEHAPLTVSADNPALAFFAECSTLSLSCLRCTSFLCTAQMSPGWNCVNGRTATPSEPSAHSLLPRQPQWRVYDFPAIHLLVFSTKPVLKTDSGNQLDLEAKAARTRT